jgi:hypothetical protein
MMEALKEALAVGGIAAVAFTYGFVVIWILDRWG